MRTEPDNEEEMEIGFNESESHIRNSSIGMSDYTGNGTARLKEVQSTK